MRVKVRGAGVAGLACAVELAERGAAVEVVERAAALAGAGCSWFAGGMLAPWCELESSGPLIARLGEEGIGWWRRRFPAMAQQGTLVIAHGRDTGELVQFARRTERYQTLGAEALAALEPDLAGRFGQALYFAGEAHLDPRAALEALLARALELGVRVRFGADADEGPPAGREVLDCTGLAARRTLAELRGVRGEMLLVRAPDVALSRPVRVLHPRLPVYIVPRGDHVYLIGATMIESDGAQRISARSMLELLSAAYALHPAFGEAEILESGVGLRPAFPDNLPRLRRAGGALYVNGLYRHGFLLAPALARRAALALLEGQHFAEVMDENPRQRRLA
ncbi:MAG TPA: FAD-dependent oxidoreductase [Steroidobacteraceae bacterium]|nr:FAD-dependent oxidoreductase [Steroidobacteraceae bacterium]